jgi:DNA-binding transcriptional LysR family regulator
VTIAQLKVFRDIAQTTSISRGATMNGISQSAASQNLKHLEKSLGVELFDRTNRPLRLTHAGRLYLTACRDIVRRYEEAESQIEALKKELVGAVRVASIYSIGLYEMAQITQQFEELHAQAHIHLEYMRPDKVYQAVLDDQADLGLISYPNPGKEVKAIPWRLETMVLVCHPDHPLAKKKTVKPADLDGCNFVSFDPDLSIRKAMDRFFREHAVQRSVVLEFDNIQMIKEAVSIGSGISILPERTVRQEVADGKMMALPMETDGLVRPVGILYRRKKRFTPIAAQFLKFLQEHPED